MKIKLISITSVLTLLATVSASAHHMWLQLDAKGKTGQVFVADDPTKPAVPMKVKGGSQTALQRWNIGKLAASENGNSLLAEALRPFAAVQLTYGIHGPDLITWYAKGCATVRDASTTLGLDYEFTARRVGTNVVFHLTGNKKPVPDCRVEVFGEGIPLDKFWRTDKKGNVTVPFPKGGRIYAAAEPKVDKVGTFKGKQYKGRLEMPCINFVVPKS